MRIGGRLGGTQVVRGGEQWVEICRLEASDWSLDVVTGTIQTSATPLSSNAEDTAYPPPHTPRIVIRCLIGAGNQAGGGAMVRQVCLAGQSLPFAGHTVLVQALICPDETGYFPSGTNPVPTSVTASVTAIIAMGASHTQQPTQWHVPASPLQTSEQVTTYPARLRQLHGYNVGDDVTYVMFFDTSDGATKIVNGDAPLFTLPLGGMPSSPSAPDWVSLDYITSSRVFQYGMYWICSSTADTLTADSGASVRLDIELFDQMEVPGGVYGESAGGAP